MLPKFAIKIKYQNDAVLFILNFVEIYIEIIKPNNLEIFLIKIQIREVT